MGYCSSNSNGAEPSDKSLIVAEAEYVFFLPVYVNVMLAFSSYSPSTVILGSLRSIVLPLEEVMPDRLFPSQAFSNTRSAVNYYDDLLRLAVAEL